MFLDRDGVLIANRPDFVRSWEEVEILPGAVEACRLLAGSLYVVVVVTNQSAVGRGWASMEEIDALNRRVVADFEAKGARFDGVFLCPHHPEAGCPCRKPRPGMLLAAAADLGLDLAASYLVGDLPTDIQAADVAGVKGILLRVGGSPPEPAAERMAANLLEAVQRILKGDWA
ncbi:MAG: HAD-IIIA family hydrolase [Proteobacteria bacterium]|nr:HAD-IIIA family hydrolase [Pseudomonadota bacterium]